MSSERPVPPDAPRSAVAGAHAPTFLVAVEWCAVTLLATLFLWRGLWPAWKTLNTDFPNYYLAAKLRQAGFPLERMYEWVWFQRQKDHFGIDQDLVGSIESTPFSGLLVSPVAWLPALAAKRVWLVFDLGVLAATSYLLARLSRLPPRRVLLVVFLALVPLRTNFLNGQQHVFILFLLTLFTWLTVRGCPRSSGLVLAMATVLKLYPGLLVLHLVWQRRWRALLSFAGAFVSLVLGGLVLCGAAPFRVYGLEVLPRLLKGEGNDPYLATLNSPTVLLRRLLVLEPQLNPRPLLQAPFIFAVLQPAVQAAVLVFTLGRLASHHRRSSADDRLAIATYVVLMLLLSPGSSTYHFCALILPAALILGHLNEVGAVRRFVVFGGLYALVCSPFYRLFPPHPGGVAIFLGFPRLYALAALWAVLLTILRPARQPVDLRWQRQRRVLTGLAFGTMTAIGAASQLRHMAAQSPGASRHAAGTTPSLITTSPAATGPEHLYYVRLDQHSYVVDRTRGGLALGLPAGVDAFHPTVDRAGAGWFEMCATISRIVPLPNDRDPPGRGGAEPALEHAEDPVVSADGKTLGFVRPSADGRGALWLADFAAGPRHPVSSDAREIVPARYDVLEFAFATSRTIVMAARPDGAPTALFHLDLETRGIHPIERTGAQARYPAVSPDGRWLVYSREEHGSWHLWLAGLATGAGRRLTDGDCNSLAPSWTGDGRTVVFATDCGRGYGQTTLAEIQAVP